MANSSVKNLNIDGNVIISGSTTSIDVQQLTTDDNNITLNDVASPTDSNANAGGLTLRGTTNHTFNWLDATDSWTASEHIDIVTGKEYKINNTSVLNATTLGSGVVNSSLTDVGTLTSLQIDNIFIDGSQIGLKTTDEDLITLTNNTVTVAGTVAATAVTGDGTGITGISTSNITVPASAGDFLYNNAGAWGGITPPITVALGGTGSATAAGARTNLGVTATGADTAYNFRANNLSDIANAATAATNLGLGTTDSPGFGGVGSGSVTITATPTSGPAAAPTFSGVVFKSVPVASGSGHKWVVGNEQDGDLAFSHFTINDAGANTSSAVGYITLDPANTRVLLGNTSGSPVNVVISDIGYPTSDGSANQVLTTNGSGALTFQTPSTTNITEGTNLYFTDARADARIAAAYLGHLSDVSTAGNAAYRFVVRNAGNTGFEVATPATTHITEGTNLYYTDARARAAISEGSTQLAYNSTTGVLTFTQGNTDTVAEGSSNLYFTNARADARIVNAGSANWNTAYTDTNAATNNDVASTLVKRDGSGHFAAGQIEATDGVLLGTTTATTAGLIRWTGTDFQGYDGSSWESLTSAATAQISGSVATFTATQTVTNTSFADVSGYTSSITVTNSNIINVQVNVDLDGPESNNHSFVQLVRVVGGTPTVLYEDESASSAAGEGDHFNITYADTHGQSNGTVITYKLMARVSAGTLTVNPNASNAQIFLQEMTTSAVTVTTVNGASGTVVLDTDDIAQGSTNLYHQDDLGTIT